MQSFTLLLNLILSHLILTLIVHITDFNTIAHTLAREQRRNFGDDIAYCLRMAKKKVH